MREEEERLEALERARQETEAKQEEMRKMQEQLEEIQRQTMMSQEVMKLQEQAMADQRATMSVEEVNKLQEENAQLMEQLRAEKEKPPAPLDMTVVGAAALLPPGAASADVQEEMDQLKRELAEAQ